MHFCQISGKSPNLMTANISGYTVHTLQSSRPYNKDSILSQYYRLCYVHTYINMLNTRTNTVGFLLWDLHMFGGGGGAHYKL